MSQTISSQKPKKQRKSSSCHIPTPTTTMMNLPQLKPMIYQHYQQQQQQQRQQQQQQQQQQTTLQSNSSVDLLLKECSLLLEIRNSIELLIMNSEKELEKISAGLCIDQVFELTSGIGYSDDLVVGSFDDDFLENNNNNESDNNALREYNQLVHVENEVLNLIEEIFEVVMLQCYKKSKNTSQAFKLHRQCKEVMDLRNRIELQECNGQLSSECGPSSPRITDRLELASRNTLIQCDLRNVLERMAEMLTTKKCSLFKFLSKEGKFPKLKKKMSRLMERYSELSATLLQQQQEQQRGGSDA